MIGALASRAASSAATTVEEEVTFCQGQMGQSLVPLRCKDRTYNGRNSKVMLLSILEEVQDIIADDDALLSRQDILDTHVYTVFGVGVLGSELKVVGRDSEVFVKS